MNLDRSFYRFVTIHACDRRTDRRTDRQTEFSSQYRVCITCSAVKIGLRLKKVCYKVSLCEHCQRQSCKAFIGLTNRAKMIGGCDSLYLKFWIKVAASIFALFSLVAPQP